MSTTDGAIRVIYLGPREGDSRQGAPVSAAEFTRVRTAVLRTCARYGTVGPEGQATGRPTGARRPPPSTDPDFHVVDDQYGDERRICVEPTLGALSAAWLHALARALRRLPEWDVLINPGGGISFVVWPDRIGVYGWRSELADLPGVVEAVRRHLQAEAAARAVHKERVEALVSELVRDGWEVARGKALALVAAFRTWSDGTEGDSVWLLHFEDASVFDLEDYRFEPDALLDSIFWVYPSGAKEPYWGRDRPSAPEVTLLAEWVLRDRGVPSRGATRLRVTKKGRAWEFNLIPH